ncbi:hypothetical protein SGGBAA2069_c00800 [Streptococcus gallolyticus subsp. gallolyticus ATCC BAA-2069]|nr:hypothetical protein SGGBAA2069_c00800 [Streptococcus gallolyticus subsp. gallolyticus ATCC BAA-2069]
MRTVIYPIFNKGNLLMLALLLIILGALTNLLAVSR